MGSHCMVHMYIHFIFYILRVCSEQGFISIFSHLILLAITLNEDISFGRLMTTSFS